MTRADVARTALSGADPCRVPWAESEISDKIETHVVEPVEKRCREPLLD